MNIHEMVRPDRQKEFRTAISAALESVIRAEEEKIAFSKRVAVRLTAYQETRKRTQAIVEVLSRPKKVRRAENPTVSHEKRGFFRKAIWGPS